MDAPHEWGFGRQTQYVDVEENEQKRLRRQKKAEKRRQKKQEPV